MFWFVYIYLIRQVFWYMMEWTHLRCGQLQWVSTLYLETHEGSQYTTLRSPTLKHTKYQKFKLNEIKSVKNFSQFTSVTKTYKLNETALSIILVLLYMYVYTMYHSIYIKESINIQKKYKEATHTSDHNHRTTKKYLSSIIFFFLNYDLKFLIGFFFCENKYKPVFILKVIYFYFKLKEEHIFTTSHTILANHKIWKLIKNRFKWVFTLITWVLSMRYVYNFIRIMKKFAVVHV